MSDPINSKAKCFNFDAVLAAFPPVFSTGASGAFMFCNGIPFTMQVQAAAGVTGHNSQQSSTVPIGPFLTENRITDPLPTLTPPNLVLASNTTNVPWSYRFVRGSSGQILIFASDGAGGMGWLALAANPAAWGRRTSFLLPSQALAEASGVQWGVLFQDNSSEFGVHTQVFLPYVDNTTATNTVLLMTCIGGNAGGLLPCSKFSDPAAAATTLLYHGAYDPDQDNVAPKISAFFADNFNYSQDSMAVNFITTPVDASGAGFASWVLTLVGASGAPDLPNVVQYLDNICMGVVETGCYNKETKCTNFTSLTPRGLSCQAAAQVSPDVTNAAYQTLCGIDPVTKTALSSTPGPDSPVMSTPDCMCMNYTQSPFTQPGLPFRDNYAQFQQWVADSGASFKTSGNTMCWLPSCITTTPGNGVITYNWPLQFEDPTKYTGKCPNSLYCIEAVNAILKDNGSVTINTLNECGQIDDTKNHGPSHAPAAAPPPPSPGAAKLTDSLVFRVGVGALIIVVLMALTYFLFKPINRPAVRYVVARAFAPRY